MGNYCNETIRTPAFSHLSMPERVKIEAGSGLLTSRRRGRRAAAQRAPRAG
jgi:hypothetical protein